MVTTSKAHYAEHKLISALKDLLTVPEIPRGKHQPHLVEEAFVVPSLSLALNDCIAWHRATVRAFQPYHFQGVQAPPSCTRQHSHVHPSGSLAYGTVYL